MAVAISFFAVLVSAIGILGLLRPEELIAFLRRLWAAPEAIVVAIVFRTLLGMALWLAAPGSEYPTAFRVLGGLSLGAAAVLPLVGRARVRRVIEWFAAQPPSVVRFASAGAIAFAVFLVGAVF